MTSIPPRILLSLAAVYLIWSSTYLALRYAVESLPALLAMGARYATSGLVLYAILRARGEAAPSRREWLRSVLPGALMFLVGNGFIALAEQRVPSSLAAVAASAMPLFACAFSLAFGERPTRREWLGVVLGFTGIVLLTFGDLRSAPGDAALLLLAPAGWALGSVLSRRLSLPRGTMSAATTMTMGGLTMVTAGIAHGDHFPDHVPLRGAIALVYLAIFGSIVAFSAYMYLLRSTTTALATSYAYVNPVLAVVLGAIVGGERPGAGLAVPGALVVAGVAVMATGSKPKSARRGVGRAAGEVDSALSGSSRGNAPRT